MSPRLSGLVMVIGIFGFVASAFVAYRIRINTDDHAFELRKVYVERCTLTPAQAERTIPEDVGR